MGECFGAVGHVGRGDLGGDVRAGFGVVGARDVAAATRAEREEDLVRTWVRGALEAYRAPSTTKSCDLIRV